MNQKDSEQNEKNSLQLITRTDQVRINVSVCNKAWKRSQSEAPVRRADVVDRGYRPRLIGALLASLPAYDIDRNL